MTVLTVPLENRSYPIYIGSGLLAQSELFERHVTGHQVMAITNETIAPLYLDKLSNALRNREFRSLVLPDGEQHKTLAVLDSVFDALLEARFGRDCTLVALGGGVIGDLAGFAAACYQRGVAHVQVPTTLLAQVDSSVGGKTAVNHRLGKNMIGAFHQPTCVVADTDTLTTLSDRELAAGLAEVIKYGLIHDAEFFAWLENDLDVVLARDHAGLAHAIHRSCEIKAEIVAADERETGVRALLNFGHTFGHAIETGVGYGKWLHGEAVAAGMCLAAELSARTERLERSDVDRVRTIIRRAKLPTRMPSELTVSRALELMAVDKKVRGGRIFLVLLEAVGKAFVTDDYDGDALRKTLDEGRSAA